VSRRDRTALALVEIKLPRLVLAVLVPLLRLGMRAALTLRRAYLEYRLAAAELDIEIHTFHAEREPRLAQGARDRAAELRVELALMQRGRQ